MPIDGYEYLREEDYYDDNEVLKKMTTKTIHKK